MKINGKNFIVLECPRCQQGAIKPMRIKATLEPIWICEECEASWSSQEKISANTFQDYGAIMESKGLKPLWTELESPEHSA
jgi:ribosomal protein L37AE/L43A